MEIWGLMNLKWRSVHHIQLNIRDFVWQKMINSIIQGWCFIIWFFNKVAFFFAVEQSLSTAYQHSLCGGLLPFSYHLAHYWSIKISKLLTIPLQFRSPLLWSKEFWKNNIIHISHLHKYLLVDLYSQPLFVLRVFCIDFNCLQQL